jgi:hypothetical protein
LLFVIAAIANKLLLFEKVEIFIQQILDKILNLEIVFIDIFGLLDIGIKGTPLFLFIDANGTKPLARLLSNFDI